jgi:hypothetical protein
MSQRNDLTGFTEAASQLQDGGKPIMTLSSERERLLRRLDESHYAAMSAVRKLDPNAMIYPEGGWRVKDVIGHLVAWEEEMVKSLQAYCDGGEYRLSGAANDDEYNEQFFQKRKDYPLERIHEEWALVRGRMKALIATLSAEQFAGKFLFPWGEHETAAYLIDHDMIPHMQEHIDDILKATGRG